MACDGARKCITSGVCMGVVWIHCSLSFSALAGPGASLFRMPLEEYGALGDSAGINWNNLKHVVASSCSLLKRSTKALSSSSVMRISLADRMQLNSDKLK
ncbi:hypothetical protein E2C01_021747 [Portunus trituberculatus]|uniref:Uncharacterized protein n=1 Tax=Portunus trituberculatus TaxID=210409 RepID=A0A5B7E480_PORTR|nr:hypothetical protein [Portunus trituberculatus]